MVAVTDPASVLGTLYIYCFFKL